MKRRENNHRGGRKLRVYLGLVREVGVQIGVDLVSRRVVNMLGGLGEAS